MGRRNGNVGSGGPGGGAVDSVNGATGDVVLDAADVGAQATDAGLTSFLGVDTAANLMGYTTAANTWASTSLTAFGRSILDDANAAAGRATLELVIGTDVQAHDADLSAIAALAKTDGNFMVADGAAWIVETGNTARTSLGLGTGDSPTFTSLTLSSQGTGPTHAARLGELAGLASKAPCRMATAAALPACTAAGSGAGKTLTGDANGALTVDGVAGSALDSVLVKNQTAAGDNGKYILATVGSGAAPFVLIRSPDFDSAGKVNPGSTISVSEGTVNADTVWMLTTNATITVDTTALTFTQIAGPHRPKIITSTPYTVLATDNVLWCDTGSGELDLPAATGSGRALIVKRMSTMASDVTLDPDGAETIDTTDGASATVVLGVAGQSITIRDGAAGVWGAE